MQFESTLRPLMLPATMRRILSGPYKLVLHVGNAGLLEPDAAGGLFIQTFADNAFS